MSGYCHSQVVVCKATPAEHALQQELIFGILACLHLDPVPQQLQELDLKLVWAQQHERHPQRPDLQEVKVPHA